MTKETIKQLDTEQILFHDQEVIDRIREEAKKFLKFNENESTICQNLGKMES
jgi:hypothetical protein